MLVWWEEFPGRYSRELRALEKAGLDPKIDQKQFQKGILEINVVVPNPEIPKETLNFRILYPYHFPFFRFEISTDDLSLPRHQHPFEKGLCFIGLSTANWIPSDTAAEFLINRLPIVLKAANDPLSDQAALLEEHQGEPFAEYYQKTNDVVFVGDIFDEKLEGVSGEFTWSGPISIEKASTPLVGVILEIFDLPKSIHTAKEKLVQFSGKFKNHSTQKGVWVKVDEPIKINSPQILFRKIVKENKLQVPSNSDFFAIGITFPDDNHWRKTSNGWIFILRIKTPSRVLKKYNYYFVSAQRVGLENQLERIPELSFLSQKTISLAGVGCLGSAAAIEFAKAHVRELRLLDKDILTPGNIVRWPLGLMYAGMPKVNAMKNFIDVNFIHTKATANVLNIGGVWRGEPKTSNPQQIEDFLSNSNLIFDATAEIGVNNFLGNLSRKRKIPYVWVEGRNGGYGGIIGRCTYKPKSGCWNCFDFHLRDKNIPTPNQLIGEIVQPTACLDQSFIGAGFDMSYIALAGVRLAISTLGNNETPSTYPDFKWDVAVINIRDKNGNPCAPKWKTFKLKIHPDCPYCGSKK